MARALRTICSLGFSGRAGKIQYRCLSSIDIKLLDEAISQRKEVIFTPCFTSFSCFGRPFTSSDLHVYAYAKDGNGNVGKPKNFTDCEDLATYSVSVDELYADTIEDLHNISKTGSTTQPIPVSALLRFLAQRGDHEKSLRSMRKAVSYKSYKKADKMSESEISCLLAVHLVSQLVFESPIPCMVSNDSQTEMSWCPCGCPNEVMYGDTGFGTEELWYGNPNILVFPLGAGSVNVIVRKVASGEISEVAEVNGDCERSIIEVERGSHHLKETASVSQIAMQAITFSFFQKVFQKNQNVPESEVVSLIPTVVLCSEGAHVYMYDTKYDICLKSKCDALPLWKEGEVPRLDLNTVITLWMMFNHLSLKPSLPKELIKHLKGSCGFQYMISPEKMKMIEKSVRMQKRFMNDQEDYPDIDCFISYKAS